MLLSSIFGLILLATPFLLVDLFSDKIRGFIYVLFFLLLYQSILAFITQALGVFYYQVDLLSILFADIILLAFYFRIKLKDKSDFNFIYKNIDWVVLIVVGISFLSLYQVHYNYSGKINLATDQTVSYHEVKHMVYPYPYFSDEWYAVSLVEGAINNHSLPVHNILDGTFFPNLELFFHSFVAQIILLLKLNPLTQYTILSLFFNCLIILLIYLFLRINKLSKLVSAITSLSALYITSGANLPGLWQFIPFNFGIVFFLISICFISLKSIKMSFIASTMASLFYPPLFIFYWLPWVVYALGIIKESGKKFIKIITYAFLSLFVIILILYKILMASYLSNLTIYAVSRLFFYATTSPYFPQIFIYNVVPWVVILLAIFGVRYIYKNHKWIEQALKQLGFKLTYNEIIEFNTPMGRRTKRCILVGQKI